jgi:uronate dehydrogenase
MKLKKLVLTGAAGRLGSYLREPLSKMCDELVSTDIADDIGTLYPGERYVQADLASYDAVYPVLESADMVVHFGAIVDEKPFEDLLGPNFIGSYNIWEAGHQHGVRRIVYASSIHAVGMHKKSDFIGMTRRTAPTRFMGWPNVLPKIWAACIGTNASLNPCICGFSAPRRSTMPAPWDPGCPMMI